MATPSHSFQSARSGANEIAPFTTPVSSSLCAQVLIHHDQAQRGDVLHVFLDGEYHHAIELPEGRSDTNLAVPHDEWRTNELVHSIDVYKASASGQVQDHQSILVSVYQAWGGSGHLGQSMSSGSCAQSFTSEPELQTVTEVVEYRVSKDGMAFGPWSVDYREPAIDGSDDGRYVVQMRFIDGRSVIQDVQTVSFEICCGVRREV